MEERFVAANLVSIAVTIAKAAKAAKEYWALVVGTPPAAAACKEYFQYRDQMYPRNRVLLFEDCLVIPSGLRPKVLTVLHAAHQGKSMMLHRAADTVFSHAAPGACRPVRPAPHAVSKHLHCGQALRVA